MASPRLTAEMLNRVRRLLDMPYRPGEIADELGITVETFTRSYIPAGVPVSIDSKGSTWINGKEFAEWGRKYLASRRGLPRRKMREGDGYCMRCRSVVAMKSVKSRPGKTGQVTLHGVCPNCSGKIVRFARAA